MDERTEQDGKLFGIDRPLIGMVHVEALPGTPRSKLPTGAILNEAITEARKLEEAGFDAILFENMHDVPYLNRSVGPEIVAMMTAVGRVIRDNVTIPTGLQILAGANREALAVAKACGAAFIRAEGFVYAHVADEGLIESDAGELLRYRRQIGAEHIRIAADIKKKHSSHAITADVDLVETAHTAEFFGADMLVVSGSATGDPTRAHDLEACARGSSLPRLVGSGTTPENLEMLWHAATGFIIGSWIKEGGDWRNPIDPGRARRIVEAAKGLRSRD